MNQASCKIYGLIGYPVKHSLSAVMHNVAFKYLDINANYRLFEVKPQDLEAFLLEDIPVKDIKGNTLRTKDIAGFNITIPHKVRAKEILDSAFPAKESAQETSKISQYAQIVGAINTVQRIGNRLEYYNTDAVGFERSLVKDLGVDTYDKNVLVIGCGGAGRAVIAGLSWAQNSVNRIFVNDINSEVLKSAQRHFSRFSNVMQKLEFIRHEQIPKVTNDCQLLINASAVGMKEKDVSVVDKGLLHEGLAIYDVIYNRETQLIKDAKSLRLPAQGGLGMLLYQGVEAFEKWTDKSLSLAAIVVMKQALQGELKRCQN